MNKRFEIVFLEEVLLFLKNLESRHYEKIIYNIRKTQVENDPELFKKLSELAMALNNSVIDSNA